MRFAEIIAEDDGLGDMVQDEADVRGDAVLVTALEELRNRAHGHTVPRVRVDSLVNLIKRLPGGEAFNSASLEDARKSNDTIKNLIRDVKEDENGIKYVYLAPFEDESGGEGGVGVATGASGPEKTVASMAKKASSSRG